MKRSETLLLTNENVDHVSDGITEFLKKCKVNSKEIIKIRIKAEELLSFYQAKLGPQATFVVKYVNGFEKRITFYFEGEAAEPFTDQNDDFVTDFIKMLGQTETWQYKHHTNIVDFKIPKRPISQIAKILIALACVALFTLLSKTVIPQSLTQIIHISLIAPTVSLLIGLFRSVACILIFTSITMGIVNIGDISIFRSVGKKTVANLFLFMTVSAVITMLCLVPWMNLTTDKSANNEIFTELTKLLFDMVPQNPLSPFIEGNPIQVIVLAVFCGMVFSLIGEKVSALKKALQQLDLFVSRTIEILNVLLPLLIFAVIQDAILANDITVIFRQKTVGLLWVIAIAAQYGLNALCIRLFGKMSVATYLKKAKAPLLISFLTSSSMAALPGNMEACQNELGADKKLVDFLIPLGQVLFMPCSAAVMIATCVGVSFVAGIAVTPAWIVTLIIISVILSVATPPIPGATSMVYSLMFAQMGLPSAYFGIAIVLGAITDSVVTTCNMSALHYLLLKLKD